MPSLSLFDRVARTRRVRGNIDGFIVDPSPGQTFLLDVEIKVLRMCQRGVDGGDAEVDIFDASLFAQKTGEFGSAQMTCADHDVAKPRI